MSHRFHLEHEVPGWGWGELTECLFTQSNWRRIKSALRYCKRNNLRYQITRWK